MSSIILKYRIVDVRALVTPQKDENDKHTLLRG